jgi:hypothetical protein
MSTYQEQFKKTIDQSFEQYHKDNPHIYQYFVHFAMEWIKSGAKKISSKQIIGRIRWHLDVEVKGDEAKDFKVSDIVTSRYSRLFAQDYPDYAQYFEFRGLRS